MTRSKTNRSFMMTSFLCALMWALCGASQVQARDLYVSPNGDSTTANTWKTAWKSFQEIDWSQVVTGDRIIVDGGTAGITYSGAFTVPVSGIVIQQAGGVNRRGPVSIVGSGPPVQTGVTISGSNVRIVGNTRGGIKISSFAGECARVLTNGNVFRNVKLGAVTGFPPYGGGRVGALVFGGVNNHFISCDFRDYQRCAVENPVAGAANVTVFRDCTFGSDGYGWWGIWGTGIYGARPGATAIDSTIHASHCVFGPILNKGIDVVQGKLNVADSLFLGSNYANLSFEPADAGATARAVVSNCTFYEPNYSGYSQYGMLLYNISTNGNGVFRIRDSIVYGGVVHVPATQVINAGNNFQYHVTGNTTAVAAAMVNPLYTAETQLWAPVTAQTISPVVWTTNSYALDPASPAIGKGSSITSVTDIVPAYGPAGHLPPLGGP